jgi:hypothetical protein
MPVGKPDVLVKLRHAASFVPFVSFGGKMACQSASISGQNPAENLASLASWRLIRIH